jgi:hypothetical protein
MYCINLSEEVTNVPQSQTTIWLCAHGPVRWMVFGWLILAETNLL